MLRYLSSNGILGEKPRRLGGWLMIVLLVVVSLFYLLPMYVMIVTGLKDSTNVSLSRMWELPGSLSGGGFIEAWNKLSPSLLNSLTMVIPATLISSLLGAVNGYLFSKWKFPGSDIVFALLLFGMFIPYQSILIPMIQFLQSIGLYGQTWGLILVHVIYGLPITTLIFRNYYAQIPNELVEAGRIDGAGIIGIFRHVMLPLSPPGFVVAGIFQFTNIWNDFLFAVTVLPNPKSQPVTVALNNLSGSFSVDWNVVMAGALVAGLPTMLIYIVLGRFFIRGLLAGSIKG